MESTLSEQAYRWLRNMIARGDLSPGTRLVSRKLAEQMGVSFTPAREAINRLAGEGMVEYVRGGGAFVRKVDRRELDQLYDLREAIEPFAAAEAARNISRHELDELQSLCDDWRRVAHKLRDSGQTSATPAQAERFVDIDERFHCVVVEASRNPWLCKIVSDIRFLAMVFGPRRSKPGLLTLAATAATLREHVRILRALRKSDSEAARALVLDSIRAGRKHMATFYAGQNGDSHAGEMTYGLPGAEGPMGPFEPDGIGQDLSSPASSL